MIKSVLSIGKTDFFNNGCVYLSGEAVPTTPNVLFILIYKYIFLCYYFIR